MEGVLCLHEGFGAVAPAAGRCGPCQPDRHQPGLTLAGLIRLELIADAQPQDLRQVMIEPRRMTQDACVYNGVWCG